MFASSAKFVAEFNARTVYPLPITLYNSHMLTREQVLHIAKLSKIQLSEAEIAKFQTQLSEVIDYFDVLQSINTDEITAKIHAMSDISNRFQTKKVGESGLDRKEALKNSKDKNEKYFVTDAVL